MRRLRSKLLAVVCGLLLLLCVAALPYALLRISFRRPYSSIVSESGLAPSLVYSVMKAESDFREDVVSKAGAVGMMQLMPATAEFICKREGMTFNSERLKDGAYNVSLGCKYLAYLLNRFPVTETALCAYNAGEGTVSEWLKNSELSNDGKTLQKIPYAETRSYVKKIMKYRKIYENLY